MIQRRVFLSTVLTGLVASTAASAQPYGPPPYPPVPPPREEFVPELRRDRLWEPGHWHWNGREYVWIRGHEIRWRERYRRFVPGQWIFRGGRWVWIGGHWE